jgi:hypothetical protein
MDVETMRCPLPRVCGGRIPFCVCVNRTTARWVQKIRTTARPR